MEYVVIFWILVAMFVAAVVWESVLTRRARNGYLINTDLPIHEILSIARSASTKYRWPLAPGQGEVNIRRDVSNGRGPTISVGIEPGQSGTYDVLVWMSSWTSILWISAYYIRPAHRRIVRIVRALKTASVSSANTGPQSS